MNASGRRSLAQRLAGLPRFQQTLNRVLTIFPGVKPLVNLAGFGHKDTYRLKALV
jgi:hypothetical protein